MMMDHVTCGGQKKCEMKSNKMACKTTLAIDENLCTTHWERKRELSWLPPFCNPGKVIPASLATWNCRNSFPFSNFQNDQEKVIGLASQQFSLPLKLAGGSKEKNPAEKASRHGEYNLNSSLQSNLPRFYQTQPTQLNQGRTVAEK